MDCPIHRSSQSLGQARMEQLKHSVREEEMSLGKPWYHRLTLILLVGTVLAACQPTPLPTPMAPPPPARRGGQGPGHPLIRPVLDDTTPRTLCLHRVAVVAMR